jgi:hypothetical protein
MAPVTERPTRLLRLASRAGRVLGLVLLASLALGPLAHAQTQPLPPLPPQPVPTPTPPPVKPGEAHPLPPPVPAPARPPAWDYELGLGALWDQNVTFTTPRGPSDWSFTPRAHVSGLVWRPRAETRITADADGFVYKEQTELNRADAGIALDGRYQLSRHVRWQIGGGYAYGHADTSSVLGEQGVLLPPTRTDTIQGSTGLAWQAGERTSFNLGARYYGVNFQDPAYTDSRSLRGTADLSRQLGRRASLALVYSFERTRDNATRELVDGGMIDRNTHYGSLRYTTTVGRASGFLLEGGASYTENATRLELQNPWNFFGGASFNHSLGRSSLAAFYRYEVLPAFGLGGVRAGNRVGLVATVPFGRSVELGLRGSYFDEASRGQIEPYRSTDAGASLGFRLASVLWMSLEGDYRRQEATTTHGVIEDVRAGAFLSVVPRNRGQATPRPPNR